MQNRLSYSAITSCALDYLKNNNHLKSPTLRHYRSRWLPLKKFMDSQKIDFVSSAICKDFLINFYDGRNPGELSANEKLVEKSVLVLLEFVESNAIKKRIKFRYLDGAIGDLMKDFISLKQSRRLSKKTMEDTERQLSNLNFWFFTNGIFDVRDIKQSHIIWFIQSLDPDKSATIHKALSELKNFFRHLYDSEIITTNFAISIPQDNYRIQSKLPSYYTEDEINQLLKSIDRGTAVGKRDYALLTLAARLGLRTSDIAGLKFENFHWTINTLTLKQYKSGKDITLPLLPVVGNSILDYIQYGRPISNEANIFLTATSPYRPISSAAIASMAPRRFCNANLNTKDRKHGGHALRHSLVKELLQNNQTLPVIMEVLGHKNLASTRHYIRIDTKSLRECALDVPNVDPLFYEQGEGNYFYQ